VKDKVVIITGGSEGIGKALALEFGRKGARVVITGRKRETLENSRNQLQAIGISVLAIQADVSRMEDNERMVQETLSHFGQIDILINNAGISMRGNFKTVDPEVIKQVMDINYYGVLYATKACLSHIIKQKGSIIAISSIAGFRGLPERSGYSSSKFAVHGLMEVIRTELLEDDVHVLIACPGFTQTDIRKKSLVAPGQSLGEAPRDESKMMSAEEVAAIIYRDTVARSRYSVMTFSGKMIVWLNKWFPALADRLVYNNFKKEKNSSLVR
jgi:dehydrogenase/reductase SDR family protein 7B